MVLAHQRPHPSFGLLYLINSIFLPINSIFLSLINRIFLSHHQANGADAHACGRGRAADAHPHSRANRSRTRAGRLNRQRPRRRASPLRRPHTLARCGAAARTSWHRRLASAVCRQVHSFVNGTRMANGLALKERSHRMQSLVSFLAVLYEYWTIRLMKLLRILCKNLYAFTWERKGNS